jgi:hypothetical protein
VRLGTRRSSAFPPLRGSKLHDFRPGSTTAARGNDLGLRLGLEELGFARDGEGRLTSPASGVPGATACQRLRGPAQKNQGKEGRLTKGSGWPELPRKVVIDNGRAAEAATLAEDGSAEVAGPSGLRETVREAPAMM